MYESVLRGSVDTETPEAVAYHHGNHLDFLARHNQIAEKAVSAGPAAIKALSSYLLSLIADARTMRLAWDDLALRGGPAPGPNGHRYTDYNSTEVWNLCGCLAEAVRKGVYHPGPARVVLIQKSSGGTRPLVLPNIEDRVVQRAVVIILQPLLDPLFDNRSCGYRPRRGHLHALALAEYLTIRQRRQVWITQDIQDAFQYVQINRLLQVFYKLLPDNRLHALLERLLPSQTQKGLAQGGPLSPLALNVHLHHFLDRPWRRKLPKQPMVRVADDLLIPCSSEERAVKVHETLAQLLIPAGMPLKYTVDNAIHDLGAGVVASWLGFNLSKRKGGLAAEISIKSWDRLEACLFLAHTKSDSPLRASHAIKQWLNQRGPCYPWSDRDTDCQRILALAQQYAFEEVPPASTLLQLWQKAYARWCKLLRSVREKYQQMEALR